MNMNFVCKLPIPKDIKEQYPITKQAEEIKAAKDKEIMGDWGRSPRNKQIQGGCKGGTPLPVIRITIGDSNDGNCRTCAKVPSGNLSL